MYGQGLMEAGILRSGKLPYCIACCIIVSVLTNKPAQGNDQAASSLPAGY